MPANIFSFRPEDHGTIHNATAKLIAANGGVDKAAERCRAQKSSLSNYANKHLEKPQYMPVDVVHQLEGASGKYFITEYLALERGCVLVQLPDTDSNTDWWHHIAKLSAEHGDVIKKASDALHDGEVDSKEAQKILKEVDEFLLAAAALRIALRSQIESK